MDNVILTRYNRPESGFNFQGWQEEPQHGLQSLLPHSPTQATAAPCTDSSSKPVLHSVPLQFQEQYQRGKAPTQSQGPNPSNAQFQRLRAQLQQLQQEKEATLAQVQRFQTHVAPNTELLQHTAANIQNTARSFDTKCVQLFNSVTSQLDNIKKA